MEIILDTFFYIMDVKPSNEFDKWKLWEVVGCIGNAQQEVMHLLPALMINMVRY